MDPLQIAILALRNKVDGLIKKYLNQKQEIKKLRNENNELKLFMETMSSNKLNHKEEIEFLLKDINKKLKDIN